MLLHAIRLRNFRAYRGETTAILGNLTALVGKNDVGKSTVFDALDIFFGSGTIDPKDRCVHANEDEPVEITCIFHQLPDALVLDESVTTTLRDEYLLNDEGLLEVKRTYTGDRMKPDVFAIAVHPSHPDVKDLLVAKHTDLKKLAVARGVTDGVDKRSNVELRRALREAVPDLRPTRTAINLAKDGAKEIWSAIEPHLPFFAVFRADRASTDEDDQVQDPMRLAVRQALKDVEPELLSIQKRVEERAREVAERTLEKLSALDERIASELRPRYRSEPKWESVFKLALDGENEIPINKRGSGVRRLVLLSFFQAEVERERNKTTNLRDVVYAIEEPETSQHPSNQVLLVDAIMDLATGPGCQVLLTTHVPALAGRLPVQSIRHITRNEAAARSIEQGDRILAAIASDLGVLPDYHDPRCQVIVCVEGPTDVEFLKGVSRAVRELDPTMPDLASDVRVAILPAGGDTLQDWITKRYLKDLRLPEIHIYDSDVAKYAEACADVNAREDGCGSWATVTKKREIENYFPSRLVNEHFGTTLVIDDACDVASDIAAALGKGKKGQFRGMSIKRNLAERVAPRITAAHLRERCADAELLDWFGRIRAHLR